MRAKPPFDQKFDGWTLEVDAVDEPVLWCLPWV